MLGNILIMDNNQQFLNSPTIYIGIINNIFTSVIAIKQTKLQKLNSFKDLLSEMFDQVFEK